MTGGAPESWSGLLSESSIRYQLVAENDISGGAGQHR
jgi:hypothetical protein